MDRIPITSRRKGLEALKWMDSKPVAELMRNEHPQIISIVLSYLEPDQAAEVLNFLPEAMRSDLVIRVATMDGVRPIGADRARRNDREEFLRRELEQDVDDGRTQGRPRRS